MNISDLQLKISEDNYTNYLLNNSIVPTNNIISKYLDEFKNSFILGSPLFEPFEIRRGELSNSKYWNKNFRNLKTDLEVLYKSFSLLNNNILNCEELYLNEKEIMFSKIKRINLMMKNIDESLKSSNDVYTYAQSFDDFYSCELNGKHNRNIPGTTSLIDLTTNNIKNNKISLSNGKVNLINSKIEIDSDKVSPTVELGKINSILNDEINEFYYIEYNTPKKATKFVATIKVNLQIPKQFSVISFECISPNTYKASLSISNDDVNYSNVYSVNSNSSCEWMFENQKVSSFVISLEKETCDGLYDDMEKYYYILKNISCINETFELSSTYVSNPITLNSVINDITLCSNENVLPGTNIDYFVCLDNGESVVEWKQLYNNEEASLGLFKNKSKILNNSLKEYGEYVGDSCYKIFDLPKGWSKNDMLLTSGYQMWRLETLDIPDGNDLLTYEPSIEDYTTYYVKRRSLVDTEEYNFSIRNCKTHILTQYIYTDEECYVRDRIIKATNTSGGTLKHKLYLNNMNIQCLNEKYNFTLKKGYNTIHIMLYVTNSTSEDFSDINHNFNFKEYTFNVFSSKPMKFMNNKEIRFNGLSSNDKYYSIENDSIIVKDDMSMVNEHIIFPNLRSDINYKNHSRYHLRFKQLNQSKEKLVDTKKNTTTIRIMANLRSNNLSYSPQINSFRIISK